MSTLIRRMTEFVAPLAILVFLVPAGCNSHEPQAAGLTAQTVTNAPPRDPPASAPYVARSKGSLTFTKHVAPIVFHKCASCHHAGEIGPFPLVSYADVQKRSKQIVQVTGSRFMPPWPATPGYCAFEGDRSLSVDEIGLIAQWANEGCREGSPSDLPALPEFPHGWKLGKPDLVLTMPEPYVLAADGKDFYRKFVLRVPIKERRYVRAYDFDPGNRKVVHHAMIRIDTTGWSRYLDQQDPLPGFQGGMFGGDRSPDGFLMGWAPGSNPPPARDASAWILDPGTDVVLELHLLRTGKPESIQPSIALYFAPTPPTEHPCLVQLQNGTIDIPAGQKDYAVEDQYVLPVESKAIYCSAHAHYLCKDMQLYAVLPDGAKTWLLRIKDWDFNWQNSYTYGKPIFLPKGTLLRMRLQYDNSADNPRNPHHPPQRVHFGPTSDDEMGDITLQLLPQNETDAAHLQEDFAVKDLQTQLAIHESRLKWKPDDWESHYDLGLLYRNMDDLEQAKQHYREALRLKPDSVWAHNNLGSVYLSLGQLDDAAAQYTQALRLDPKDGKAHNNLGLILLHQGKLDPAAVQFEQALRSNPEFPEAETNLGLVFVQRGELRQAAAHFERALKFNPDYEDARINLDRIRESLVPQR